MPKSIKQVFNAIYYQTTRLQALVPNKVQVYPTRAEDIKESSEGSINDIDFRNIIDVKSLDKYFYEIKGTFSVSYDDKASSDLNDFEDVTIPVSSLNNATLGISPKGDDSIDSIMNFGTYRVFFNGFDGNIPKISSFAFRLNMEIGKFEYMWIDGLNPDNPNPWKELQVGTVNIVKCANLPVVQDLSKLNTTLTTETPVIENDVNYDTIMDLLKQANTDKADWGYKFMGIDYDLDTDSHVVNFTVIGDGFYNIGTKQGTLPYIPNPAKAKEELDEIMASVKEANDNNFGK